MGGLRRRLHLGLVLLVCALAGPSAAPAGAPAAAPAPQHHLRRAVQLVRQAEENRRRHGAKTEAPLTSQARSADPRDSRKVKTTDGEKTAVTLPRGVRKKYEFIIHITGQLYFSPKCRKHMNRLYHHTRDCTTPAYLKRCARLLTRLAGSPQCTEG